MNRVENNFFELSALSEQALMPFVCGGFPGRGATAQILPALERAGAKFVEIGIPFSDPIADGPIIAAAMHEALLNGATPAAIFDEVRSVRDQSRLAIIAMVSVSIVHRMGGPAAFCVQAKSAGFDGLIVPDVPFDESAELQTECKKHDLTLSLLISPTTPVERAISIAKACTGFVYLLARTGITGESGGIPEIETRVKRLKEHVSIPIAVGFGISTAEHVRAVVAQGADAAIVGSALVRRMKDALAARKDPIAEAESFTRELSRGLSKPN